VYSVRTRKQFAGVRVPHAQDINFSAISGYKIFAVRGEVDFIEIFISAFERIQILLGDQAGDGVSLVEFGKIPSLCFIVTVESFSASDHQKAVRTPNYLVQFDLMFSAFLCP